MNDNDMNTWIRRAAGRLPAEAEAESGWFDETDIKVR